jgi:hypothetical protein
MKSIDSWKESIVPSIDIYDYEDLQRFRITMSLLNDAKVILPWFHGHPS